MNVSTKKILGIPITIDDSEYILKEIIKYLRNGAKKSPNQNKKSTEPIIIFTPNPEIMVHTQEDVVFNQIVSKAQINIPDGNGIVWALKKLHHVAVRRLAGVDLCHQLAKTAAFEGFTLGLIGGRTGVALKAGKCLRESFPKIKIKVFEAPELRLIPIKISPESSNEKDISNLASQRLSVFSQKSQLSDGDRYFRNLANDIVSLRIDILFVAFGFPKQEFFIESLRKELQTRKSIVLMGVGGSFDYLSQNLKRAPLWMRRIGLEWMYRLYLEPRRLSRQLKGSKFFFKIIQSSLFPTTSFDML